MCFGKFHVSLLSFISLFLYDHCGLFVLDFVPIRGPKIIVLWLSCFDTSPRTINRTDTSSSGIVREGGFCVSTVSNSLLHVQELSGSVFRLPDSYFLKSVLTTNWNGDLINLTKSCWRRYYVLFVTKLSLVTRWVPKTSLVLTWCVNSLVGCIVGCSIRNQDCTKTGNSFPYNNPCIIHTLFVKYLDN